MKSLSTSQIKKRQRIVIVLFVIALFVPTSIYEVWDKYGKRYNETRQELGVLEIPEDWEQHERGTKSKLWTAPNLKKIKKGRKGKLVIVDDNCKLSSEEDKIVYKDENEDIEKDITITYNYSTNDFEYIYGELKDNTYIKQERIGKVEFEQFLGIWGIQL